MMLSLLFAGETMILSSLFAGETMIPLLDDEEDEMLPLRRPAMKLKVHKATTPRISTNGMPFFPFLIRL